MIRIYQYGEVPNEEILARVQMGADVEQTVADIIAQVRAQGDDTLFAYTEKFDHARLDTLRVSEAEIQAAYDAQPQFTAILEQAAANIRAFHEKQVRNSFIMTQHDGVVMGQKVMPIERVGLYVPGGTAAYPSTVLMDAIPAKIAGCSKIVMVTPPAADGSVNAAILAAARVAGVDEIY